MACRSCKSCLKGYPMNPDPLADDCDGCGHDLKTHGKPGVPDAAEA